MPGLTNVIAYKTIKEAKDAAEDFLNNGFEVAVTGRTSVVRLTDDKKANDYWSIGDNEDIIVLIASTDGIAEIKLPD